MNIRTKKIIYLYKIANNENKDSLNILNENILDIQNHLIAAGYELPTHGADGLLGPETYRALLDFKRDNNLPETKELSEDELNILKSKKKDNKLNNFKTKNIIVGSGPFPWECTGSSLPFKASFARCDTVFDDVTLCMMM